MPAVFKRNFLEDLPAGAAVETKGGKRVAVWTEGGRTRKAEVVTTRKGDKIVTGESSTYYGKLRVGKKPHHHWKTVPLFSDKTASERELNRLQCHEDRKAAGVVTVEMSYAAKPLAEHAADYLAALKLMGVSDEHYRIAKWTLERLLTLTGWARVADVTADSLRAALAKLKDEGKATNYLNKFTSRAKALVHWMQENGRISLDPLAGVKRGNAAKGKRTRSRRAMTEDELRALLAAAPVDRRRKYLFAALSGLRRGELSDLRWGDLRLKAPIPFIQLREDQTKNQKADAVPLHPALVRVLTEIGEGGAEDAGVRPDAGHEDDGAGPSGGGAGHGCRTRSRERGPDRQGQVRQHRRRPRPADRLPRTAPYVQDAGGADGLHRGDQRRPDPPRGQDGRRRLSPRGTGRHAGSPAADPRPVARGHRRDADPARHGHHRRHRGRGGGHADGATTGARGAPRAHQNRGGDRPTPATIGNSPEGCQVAQLPYNPADWQTNGRSTAAIGDKSLNAQIFKAEYPSGLRGRIANPLFVGSNPTSAFLVLRVLRERQRSSPSRPVGEMVP